MVAPAVAKKPVAGGVVVEGVGVEDAPKENTEDGVEPNPDDCGACQLEPNTLVAGPLLKLPDLASEEAAMELTPKLGDEPNWNGTV